MAVKAQQLLNRIASLISITRIQWCITSCPGKGPIPAPPIESERWYPVAEVSDGSEFAIEVQPGFEYGVEFLGVDMPRIYAGSDSSDYYSAEAAKYVRNLISGGEVKLQGAGSTDRPEAGY